jgi:hypothetical protein
MKTYGAFILCKTCGAQPHPDDPMTTRETFDLRKVDDSWFCELHRPPKEKRAPRIAAGSPLEALTEFERLFSTQGARLGKALRSRNDDGGETALEAYRSAIERGFASLKKAIVPPEPPGGEAKPAHPKPVSRGKRSEQQGDWLDEKEPTETLP